MVVVHGGGGGRRSSGAAGLPFDVNQRSGRLACQGERERKGTRIVPPKYTEYKFCVCVFMQNLFSRSFLYNTFL